MVGAKLSGQHLSAGLSAFAPARGMDYWIGCLGAIAALALAGCADGGAQRELLQPWAEVAGGQVKMQSGVLNTDYILLQNPAAISARGNFLYLVDSGLRRIFRYDRAQQTLQPFAENVPVEEGMAIFAASDQSVYITVPSSGKVLHFTWGGMQLPSMSSPGNLAHPASLVADDSGGGVWVSDALYNHIVVFGKTGEVRLIIKPPQAQSISAMSAGPDGVYVVDGHAKRVVVFGWNGMFRYAFATDTTDTVGSIAVSSDNLVFVGVDFGSAVSVYGVRYPPSARLVGKITEAGFAGKFNGIGGLAVENDTLFVADSLNARIQALLIDAAAINSGR